MSESIKTKQCSRCKEIKETSKFNPSPKYKDGYFCWCKQCRKEHAREYRKRANRYEIYDKLYWKSKRGKIVHKRYRSSKKGKKSACKCSAIHRIKYPEQSKAASAIKHEIKSGRMPHPTTLNCTECRQNAKEYHHHNGYSEEHRLDVVPVCKLCHIHIHQSLKRTGS